MTTRKEKGFTQAMLARYYWYLFVVSHNSYKPVYSLISQLYDDLLFYNDSRVVDIFNHKPSIRWGMGWFGVLEMGVQYKPTSRWYYKYFLTNLDIVEF